MTAPELSDWSFPSGVGVPLCALKETAAELAVRLGRTLQVWDEDGLGPARGFALRLSDVSGLWLKEFGAHHPEFRGPIIEVDAGEAAGRGFDALMSEAAAALNLKPDSVSWRPDDGAGWAGDASALVKLAKSRSR